MSRPVTVVVTGAGSSTAMGVIKGLVRQKEAAIRVVACDVEPLSAGAFVAHRFYRVPRASHPSYLARMTAICRLEGARLLVPVVDEEFATLSESAARFEAIGTRVAVSPCETLEVCSNKELTARFFASIDVPTPATWRAGERAPGPADYPVILKPRIGGRGSLGVHRADDRAEYDFYRRRSGDCLVQSFIEGEEYTIDCLSDFDRRPLAVVPRRRLEVRSGISYKGIVVRNERMSDLARRILEQLRIVGPACIQCIVRGADLFFLEVNPRFGGATAFTIAGARVNTPLMLVRAACGQRVRPRLRRYRDGVTLLRYWDEVVVTGSRRARRAGA